MSRECDDEDLRCEAIDERRAMRRRACQCEPLPGRYCPGPANCPYSGDEEDTP